jgi:hypothetical protein
MAYFRRLSIDNWRINAELTNQNDERIAISHRPAAESSLRKPAVSLSVKTATQ